MSLNNKLDGIKCLVGLIEEQIEELEKNNVKASSTKARHLLQKVKTECHDLRADCLVFVKSISKKKAVVEEAVVEEAVVEEAVAEESPSEDGGMGDTPIPEAPKKKPKRKTKVNKA